MEMAMNGWGCHCVTHVRDTLIETDYNLFVGCFVFVFVVFVVVAQVHHRGSCSLRRRVIVLPTPIPVLLLLRTPLVRAGCSSSSQAVIQHRSRVLAGCGFLGARALIIDHCSYVLCIRKG